MFAIRFNFAKTPAFTSQPSLHDPEYVEVDFRRVHYNRPVCPSANLPITLGPYKKAERNFTDGLSLSKWQTRQAWKLLLFLFLSYLPMISLCVSPRSVCEVVSTESKLLTPCGLWRGYWDTPDQDRGDTVLAHTKNKEGFTSFPRIYRLL